MITIKHPEDFTGSASGLEFVSGIAEVASLSDEARAVLSDHGFTFDGESEGVATVTVAEHTLESHPESTGDENPGSPVEVVGEPVPEGTEITTGNAAVVEHSDGTVEVGTITEQPLTVEDVEKVAALGETLPKAKPAPKK